MKTLCPRCLFINEGKFNVVSSPAGQQVNEVEVKQEQDAIVETSPSTSPVGSTSSGSPPAASPTQFEAANGQLTPTEGSVRSDEGYHSNGYHDDFNLPEDSSDSENDNNYVLDFR